MNGSALRWLMSLGHSDTAAAARRDVGAPGLVIIRHHRVYGADEAPLYRLGVSEPVLDAQLAMLARAGLAPITVAEGVERLAAGAPGTRVALSFDDGYADNLERALPLLRRHGARATLYVTAGLVDARVAPWWDELEHVLARTTSAGANANWGDATIALAFTARSDRERALAALLPHLRVTPDVQRRRLDALRAELRVDTVAPCALATWEQLGAWTRAGMEVGAHTLSHPFLSLLTPEGQAREIAGSIQLIAERLATRPTGFAYPGGDHDSRTVDAARAAGLRYAVGTRAGRNDAATPMFELLRRGLPEVACLGPGGRFSRRMAMAELDGAFDRLREARAGRNGGVAASEPIGAAS